MQLETRLLLVLIPPDVRQKSVSLLNTTLQEVLDPKLWRVELVRLADADLDSQMPVRVQDLAARQAAAALWWFPPPTAIPLVKAVKDQGLVSITFNRDYPSTGTIGVVADVQQVAGHHFERLWRLGKRRFALLSIDKESPSIRQFCQIITDLAHQHGVGEQFQHLVLSFAGTERPTPEMGARISQMMSGNPRPDAVLCAELFSFRGLEIWLAEHSEVRVPEDLAIASCDYVDRPYVARLQKGVISAQMDIPSMLKAAAAQLQKVLDGQPLDQRVVAVPAVLVDSSEGPARNS